MIDPLLKGLAQFRSATITAAIHELQAKCAVATRNAVGMTPAHGAAAAGHTSCVRFLSEIGGTAALLHDVQADPELLEDEYSCLLLDPRLLDLPTKQAWLSWSLEQTVDGAGAEQLELVCRRDNMLQGLCGMFG
jgi:hypothetical protein